MASKVPFRLILLVFVAATAPILHAQFQEPTPAELKMTADPKAPGAAAVYLYREETTDDHLHFHSYYERVKILTEKGKELATIHVPYQRGGFKVTDIKGRTIHSDGTIVPLTSKPEDLMEARNSYGQINQMVFTLPSVEVGSILEYRLQLRYDDNMVSSPFWEIQQPFFVEKAHYSFQPENTGGRIITNSRGEALNRIMWNTSGIPVETVHQSNTGRFTVDVTDIPPIPTDDWMPPLNTIKWRVEFYYTNAHSGVDFWETESKRWAKDTEHFANPSSHLKEAVAQIVAPTDTDEQKARKIYAAVMKLDNTRFSRRMSEAERKAEKLKPIKDAEDVWKQQSGTDDEIALLYIAMARAAGLKVWPMKVVDRNRAIFDPRFLNFGQMDDYIAIVDLGGKEVYLDPGQKMCAFGQLHWIHSLASGVRLSEKGAGLATTPAAPYNADVYQRVAELTIDPTGAVGGTIRYIMTGPDALYWRQLTLNNDQDEVKKRFNESLRSDLPDGVQADFDHFLALDDYTTNLIAVIKVSGNLGTATGKHFFLPGLFFESHATHPFVAQDKREIPVDVHYARMVTDDVTYHLPPGFSVETDLQPAAATWPNHALLRISAKPIADGVSITRSLAYNFTLLDPKEYSDLHGFYQKVAAADQQQLVLTRAVTVAKGN
jgi:transglutaminase-like putative cysteine protease